jgi:gas vesicle protein
MDSDREREAWSFVTGLILGGVIGASVAMLTAPQPGRKTRRRIRRSASRLRGSTSTRFDELADELRGRVDEAIHAARDHLG